MAYIDQTTGGKRKATVMIAVAALQGAAIIALVNGLAVKLIIRPPEPPLSTKQWPIEQPPLPPKPVETHKPVDTHITRVKPPIEVGPAAYNPPEPQTPMVPEQPTQQLVPQKPPLPLAPTIMPTVPKPLGRPGEWVTSNDYPSRDLREGNQGITGFRLTVGINGRVQSCALTKPSGFPGLDAAACNRLTSRAKFKPATENGQPVVGDFSSSVRWEIPEQ